MSYILEALRKSERERQTGAVPALPDLVAAPPPPRRPLLPWLVVALLAFNGVGLGYLWWQHRTKPAPTASVAAPPSLPSVTGPIPVSPPRVGAVRVEPAATPGAPIQTPSLPAAAARDQAPPTHLVQQPVEPVRPTAPPPRPADARPSPPEPPPAVVRPGPPHLGDTPAPAPRPVTPPPLPKPGAAPRDTGLQNPGVTATEVPAAAHRPPARLSPTPTLPQRLDIRDEDEDEPELDPRPRARPRDIPLLGETPPEFRERVPTFRINVHAYSKIPSERFTIIDMKRYQVGDELPGGLKLLEIRADSLVFEMDGTRFQVQRQ